MAKRTGPTLPASMRGGNTPASREAELARRIDALEKQVSALTAFSEEMGWDAATGVLMLDLDRLKARDAKPKAKAKKTENKEAD